MFYLVYNLHFCAPHPNRLIWLHLCIAHDAHALPLCILGRGFGGKWDTSSSPSGTLQAAFVHKHVKMGRGTNGCGATEASHVYGKFLLLYISNHQCLS